MDFKSNSTLQKRLIRWGLHPTYILYWNCLIFSRCEIDLLNDWGCDSPDVIFYFIFYIFFKNVFIFIFYYLYDFFLIFINLRNSFFPIYVFFFFVIWFVSLLYPHLFLTSSFYLNFHPLSLIIFKSNCTTTKFRS